MQLPYKKFCGKNLNNAFTLAEVLVVLAIIGVVAAITLPALIENIKDKQFKEAFRKNFADFDQATKLIANDNGGTIKGSFGSYTSFINLYAQRLNVVKICTTGNAIGNCWPTTVTNLNGSSFAYYGTNSFVLSNGTFASVDRADPNCAGGNGGLNPPIGCALIKMDVNGLQGPNTYGKDILEFHIFENRAYPRGGEIYDSQTCTRSGTGEGCGAYVIENKDY